MKLSSACELREATKSSLCIVKLLGARIFTSGAVTLSAVTPSVFKGSTCEIYEVVFLQQTFSFEQTFSLNSTWMKDRREEEDMKREILRPRYPKIFSLSP